MEEFCCKKKQLKIKVLDHEKRRLKKKNLLKIYFVCSLKRERYLYADDLVQCSFVPVCLYASGNK